MKLAYKYILLLISCLVVYYQGLAQQEQILFHHLDIYDGLSHNQVNCILKDDQGFMWFGTLSGLNRYDGYSFKVFRHDIRDSTSLTDSYITGIDKLPGNKLWVQTRTGPNIYDPATESFNSNESTYLKSLSLPKGNVNRVFQDEEHNFWFVYDGDGAYRYIPSSGTVAHVHYIPNTPTSLSDNYIAAIASDTSRFLWIIHRNGILEKLDTKTLHVQYRNDDLLMLNKGREEPYEIFIDRQGDLWIYAKGRAKGVFYFDVDKKTFRHITTTSDPVHLNKDVIYGIVQDKEGTLWVGTDHGGIDLINKKKGTIRYLMHSAENNRSLAQNSIYTLYRDSSGMIWVGTYKKGVSYYDETLDHFPLISHNPHLYSGENSQYKSLPYADVNRFVEDKKGNLWIGTNGGGLLYYDRENHNFKQFKHNPDEPNSLCNNVIVALCLDDYGKLWIGTYMGGLDCFDGEKFTHYHHINGDSSSLSNNSVWDIFEDSQNNLWLGTLGGGLDRFNRRTKTFVHYKNVKDIDGISYVLSLAEYKNKNLWIGTAAGIEVMNLESGGIHYYHHINTDSNSLSNDNINAIYPDSRGWVWIGTREGLSLYQPSSGQFRTFTTRDGLPTNTILTILEDNQHRIWMSTPEGLSRLTIAKNQHLPSFEFKNYNEADGLQGREFNDKAALKMRSGALIFGGSNGFNLFNPGKVKSYKKVPPVVLTDFQIFNKSIKIGENIKKHVILPRSITQLKTITIPHGANDFSIVFAALGYGQSGKNKYAYKLQGFNNDWITSNGSNHKATFTNLDPGDYTFMVKASNKDGVWSQSSRNLEIRVLPPFWLTTWAYILYALIIIGILLLARRILLYRARMKFKMEHQRNEARRIHELDMMKIRFFTNISHEFRTPLSLIIAPIERLIAQSKEEQQGKQLKLIRRNAKRLLHLVNQLLDFRKMEVQEIVLHPVRADIIQFIQEEVRSFTDLAEKKNIQFSIENSIGTLEADFDPGKLERILFNLLSNAFKFTHEEGKVTVYVEVCSDLNTDEGKGTFLQIRVQDNGIGIPYEKQKFIFKRFFQHEMPETVVNPGSGIGLAITHEFVRLHHGRISVKSEPNHGSCFTVRLPVNIEVPVEKKQPDILSLNNESSLSGKPERQRKKRTVLLIDDNEDFRFYLKDNLSVYYDIVESGDGMSGWNKALLEKPDLIVSDVMMPGELDGIRLSKKLKKNPRTTDIPVILLTARASEEQRLQGFKTGANAYIIKPFNFEILLARIHNLLEEQKRKRRLSSGKIDLKPKDLNISSEEEKLVREAVEIVEKNMDNPQFSVKELSNELYMSRVTLHKKLSKITGKTPSLFIRELRIKRAAQLIEKGKMNISQTAYEVGFNNPKYFTKYFKEEFGVLPSEYGKEKV
ncbi:MAG TPA: two-component regulator propeller domain-containing protein [Chitinophagaceae bacterium]|nr:two-component regulator propeller domain-containing protein [Chitinophagaceae bacterium]